MPQGTNTKLPKESVIMHEIDLTNKDWGVYPRSPINDVPESFDVCGEDQFVIVQRIGSSSLNGRVYEIERKPGRHFTPVRLALKIFEDDGGSESEIASMLGSRYPDNFPRVVSHGTCPHVILRNENDCGLLDSFAVNEETKFRKRFVVDNNTMDSMGRKRLRANLKKVHTTGDDLFTDMEKLGVPDESIKDLREYNGVKMKVMASELMSGDLIKYVEKMKKSKETPRLISEVFEALNIMVKEGIVHGDLHLGNVLLRKSRDGTFRAVIHDFGESRTEYTSPDDHVDDILFFIHALTASVGDRYKELLVVCNTLARSLKGTDEVPITRDDVCSTIDKMRAWFFNLQTSMKG